LKFRQFPPITHPSYEESRIWISTTAILWEATTEEGTAFYCYLWLRGPNIRGTLADDECVAAFAAKEVAGSLISIHNDMGNAQRIVYDKGQQRVNFVLKHVVSNRV